MESNIAYLILKNTARLEKLIKENAPYDKILKQSQKLDKYILIKMRCINKIVVNY